MLSHYFSSTPLQKAKKEFIRSCCSEWKCDPTFDETRTAIGKAFCGNDQVGGEPETEWVMGSRINNTCTDKEGLYTFIMSFIVNQAFRDGALVLVKTTQDGNFGATAVLVEYMGPMNYGRFRKIMEGLNWFLLGIVLAFSGEVPDICKEKTPEDKNAMRQAKARGDRLMELIDESHSQYVKGPHWYLKLIGTDPKHQGQGLGSTMMKKINELADSQKRDLYLECGNEKNREFYLKFGYDVVGEHEVTDPTGFEKPNPLYCMLRKFKSTSQ